MVKKRTSNKQVKCIETGEVFISVQAAADFAGRKIATMSRHLHGYNQTCGGYHFEFIDEDENFDARFLRGEVSIDG